jgi:hypothetical protein
LLVLVLLKEEVEAGNRLTDLPTAYTPHVAAIYLKWPIGGSTMLMISACSMRFTCREVVICGHVYRQTSGSGSVGHFACGRLRYVEYINLKSKVFLKSLHFTVGVINRRNFRLEKTGICCLVSLYGGLR